MSYIYFRFKTSKSVLIWRIKATRKSLYIFFPSFFTTYLKKDHLCSSCFHLKLKPLWAIRTPQCVFEMCVVTHTLTHALMACSVWYFQFISNVWIHNLQMKFLLFYKEGSSCYVCTVSCVCLHCIYIANHQIQMLLTVCL